MMSGIRIPIVIYVIHETSLLPSLSFLALFSLFSLFSLSLSLSLSLSHAFHAMRLL